MTIVVEFFILLKIIKTGLFSCFQYFLNNSAHCNKTTFKMLVMTILLGRNNTIVSLITGFQEHGGWWKMPLAYWQTCLHNKNPPAARDCGQDCPRLHRAAQCPKWPVVMATPSFPASGMALVNMVQPFPRLHYHAAQTPLCRLRGTETSSAITCAQTLVL